jgi:hypothetical protein
MEVSDKTLVEILAERRAQLEGREEQIDAAVDAADPTPAAEAPPPPPPKEKRGQGRDFADANIVALMKQLRARYEAAKRANNVDLMAKVEAQMKQLEESAKAK